MISRVIRTFFITFVPMKLIADSGSTKTDWVLADGADIRARLQTQGINPFHQSEDDIRSILHAMGEVRDAKYEHLTIHFYGSGIRPELEPLMERLLREAFSQAAAVEAHSDLLGAARAVCGRCEGIACILGTGANSGLYDGQQIVRNTPPLGYVLGDEGSGAVLGRQLLNALYKSFMPSSLLADFQLFTGMDMADVISRVYRQPLANRFLASLSPFIKAHLDLPEMRQMVIGCFRDFFSRNVVQYGRRDLPVGFVGSIADCYREQLAEAAAAEGFALGSILKSPIDGLVAYHQSHN